MKFTWRTLSIIGLILSAGILVAWANTDQVDKVKVGDDSPAFRVITPDGEVTNEDLRGKLVLINFFATWCPPCIKELPVLQKDVWEKFKGNDDFVLLVVGREHTMKELNEFAKSKGFDLPFCPDEKRAVFGQFATQSIPRNYVIDKKGKVIYASKGYNHQEFEQMISIIENNL